MHECMIPQQTVIFLRLQVLTVKQAAQLLISLEPQQPIREEMWNYLARQYGYPTKEQVILNAPFGPTPLEWDCAWQYTEGVSPSVPVNTDYVPVQKTVPAAKPVHAQDAPLKAY